MVHNISELENQILHAAIVSRATDIHIEPRGNEWEVRFRNKGILMKNRTIQKPEALALIQRLKVKGNMDISEKRIPQDGSFVYVIAPDNFLDLRLSSLPTIEGEKLTLRILYRDPEFTQIDQLGFGNENYEELLSWLSEPYGLILVTGPTGSGKTTTLYAILQHIDNGLLNICTIEDPVEFRIKGINQVQVNELAGLSFAKGLRSLLRQDPDVIMIGEIRDKETAEIAIRASLTGHLVLATIHSNDAANAITRLTEMGIEPYLITSTLRGVIAQTMYTHLCPNCKGDPNCNLCEGKFVLKRSPQFELMRIREEMTPYILNKRPASEIKSLCLQFNNQLTLTF